MGRFGELGWHLYITFLITMDAYKTTVVIYFHGPEYPQTKMARILSRFNNQFRNTIRYIIIMHQHPQSGIR